MEQFLLKLFTFSLSFYCFLFGFKIFFKSIYVLYTHMAAYIFSLNFVVLNLWLK